jgi:alkylation response protein AidB-like acyl-CoA dehydrogenase
MDTTRRLARLSFSDAPVATLLTDAGPALEAGMDTAVLLLAAEQLGGAQHLLEATVDYAQSRVQFGRPIGSFQAIKHRCADLLIDVELSRSLVYHALHQAQHHPETLAVEAALTRSFVSDAYLRAAGASLQIHGGIGFTWEHPTHLYLKRAKSSQLIFGTPTQHRRRLARLLGLAEGADTTDTTDAATTGGPR